MGFWNRYFLGTCGFSMLGSNEEGLGTWKRKSNKSYLGFFFHLALQVGGFLGATDSRIQEETDSRLQA